MGVGITAALGGNPDRGALLGTLYGGAVGGVVYALALAGALR